MGILGIGRENGSILICLVEDSGLKPVLGNVSVHSCLISKKIPRNLCLVCVGKLEIAIEILIIQQYLCVEKMEQY